MIHIKAWELEPGDKYRLVENADWIEVTSVEFDRNFAFIRSRTHGHLTLRLTEDVQVVPVRVVRRTWLQLKRDIAYARLENYRKERE